MKKVRIREYFLRLLAKNTCLLGILLSTRGDFGEMESWATNLPHVMFCISTLRLDETFILFIKPVVCVAGFPSCGFPLQPFISPKRYMPNVGPSILLYVPEDHSPEVKLPWREVNHSLLSSADVKNATSYTFIPPICFSRLFAKLKKDVASSRVGLR